VTSDHAPGLVADSGEPSGEVRRALVAGTKVEVRRRYDHRWARGFEVAAVDGDSYMLRRLSDGAVLPTPFPRAELRRERQGTWWF